MTTGPRPADILAVGLTTPVGLDALRAAAAIRAGITRFSESKIQSGNRKPQVLSLVEDEFLPVLDSAIQRPRSMAPARVRMLRLSTYALREASAPCTEPPPLLLALPENRPGTEDVIAPRFVEDLALQTGVKLDERNSRLYRQGGAGGLFALRDALALLAAERFPYLLVGGVDSLLGLRRLGELDAEGRLQRGSMDGFLPGEGAAFLLLGSGALCRHLGLEPLAHITGVGVGSERGHRSSKEPYRGEGLAEAFQVLFASLPAGVPKVDCVYAGFNGENMPAKEWGVAYIRSSEYFADDLRVEHPADCIGDAGVALGPIMLALAAIDFRKGYQKEPCLVWSTSEEEARAAAMVQSARR